MNKRCFDRRPFHTQKIYKVGVATMVSNEEQRIDIVRKPSQERAKSLRAFKAFPLNTTSSLPIWNHNGSET